MNAIKYIKDHGVDKAREELTKLPNSNVTHMTSDARMFIDENNPLLDEFQRGQIKDLICIEELKRLVESVDIITKVGGIREAIEEHTKWMHAPELHLYRIGESVERLKQAIADYESIYGGEHV